LVARNRVQAIFKADIRVAFKDYEQLLLMIGLPILFLLFFSNVNVIDLKQDPITFLTPGILTLGLLSIAFVRLAISLGFDRTFGAIKRYSLTPLSSSEFLLAKILVTLFLFSIQTFIIVGLAITQGWEPSLNVDALGAAVLGIIIFSALAYIIGGLFEGFTSLAMANAVYVLLLLFSGIIFEIDKLPSNTTSYVRSLPSTAMAEIFRNSFQGLPSENWPWITLAVWAVATPIVAVKIFKWN